MKFRVLIEDYDYRSEREFDSIDAVHELVNEVEALSRSKEFVGNNRASICITEIIEFNKLEITPDECEVMKLMDKFKADYLNEQEKLRKDEEENDKKNIIKLLKKFRRDHPEIKLEYLKELQ